MSVDWVKKYRLLRPKVRDFVDGQWCDVGGSPIEKHSPRDGDLLCQYGVGDERAVHKAIEVTRQAYLDGRWSGIPLRRRKDILHRLASLVDRHIEELALLESVDVGKPIHDALTFDVPAAAAVIRYAAEAADSVYGKVYGADRSGMSYQLRRPIGVIAGIVGWNFPLLLTAGKLGPVLATGNAFILKPSEVTSLSAARIAELAVEAGVPEGVFNVVHGDATIGNVLTHHHGVDLVTFTGSTQTGRKLLIASGQSNLKRMILECGGKAPNLVFEDCPNLDAVAEAVVARAFWNQGQVCTASSRLLVQESIKDDLLRRVIERASALRPGDPLNLTTRFGAVVSAAHQEKIRKYINCGTQEGAKLIYQSDAVNPIETGFYVSPVIFSDVSPRQRIAQEEIFGPVLSVLSFRDEQEAIQLANETIYGLSAIVWTRDLGRAHRLSQGLHVGWLVINATANPIGGLAESVLSTTPHKQSGIGSEGGIEGLEAYTAKTAVQFFV